MQHGTGAVGTPKTLAACADAIAANTKSISDEVTRAKAAEKTNSDAITANSNAIAAINAKLLTPMITYEEVTA